jgi:exopolysaccharide biosynthesis polyprenyl glycosylphosphotransferase
MLRRFSANFAVFSIFMDLLIIPIMLRLVIAIRPLLNPLPFITPIQEITNLPVIIYILFSVLWVSIFATFSVYDGRRNIRVADEFASLTQGSIVAAISMAGILYFTFREVSRALFIIFVVSAFLAMILWRSAARFYFRTVREGLAKPQRVLIAGAGLVGHDMQAKLLEHKDLNLHFIGFLDDDAEKRQKEPELILGSLAEARTVIENHQVDDLVIALPLRAYDRTNHLVADLFDLPVKVWVIPDYFSIALHQAVVEDFASIPMLDLRAPALDEYQRMLKRGFDIIMTILLLIPFLPAMIVIGLLVLLIDGWPILFFQKRVGENGRMFNFIKFRTMRRDAELLKKEAEFLDEEGNLIHKRPDDPRITPLGKFLRHFSLDELPQFFNILAGNMSLVGPRPELPELVEKYQPWQRQRFAVPQGLTGWWQIHGRSDKPMHLHTEDDLYYVNHYSIWLDIEICVKTLWIVMRGKGAY